VGLIVDLGKTLKVKMGVDLGGTDLGMAKELLHSAQVATGLQQVAGEGMPQHMRVYALAQAKRYGTRGQPSLHRAGRKPEPPGIDENGMHGLFVL
jgi:hypothetical protein